MKTIFLSSTGKDLFEYRDAVFLAIQKLKGFHCIRMEDFVAADEDSLSYCLAAVAECDIFVGMIGHYYGSCPKGIDKSYTQLEYEKAQTLKKPRLMFVAPENFMIPANLRESEENHNKQKCFRNAVLGERIVSSFNSSHELALQATTAISNYLLQSFSTVNKQENSFILIVEGGEITNVSVQKLTEGFLNLSPNPQDIHIKKITIISQNTLKQVSLDFTSGVLPNGVEFKRASGGYCRINSNGHWVYANVNEPRFEEISQNTSCLLVEPARTNLLLNSSSPTNQRMSLGPGTFTLWVEGNGSAEVKSVVNGISKERNPFIFTLDSSQKVEIFVHGEINHIQLETGPFPTSLLPTKHATLTRASDLLFIDVARIM